VLEAEKRARVEAEAESVAHVQELDELLKTHEKDVDTLTSELKTAHDEVPALEAEITVLRGELSSMRTQLDSEILVARTANEQLDRNRALLEQARRSLDELLRRGGAGPKPPPETGGNS